MVQKAFEIVDRLRNGVATNDECENPGTSGSTETKLSAHTLTISFPLVHHSCHTQVDHRKESVGSSRCRRLDRDTVMAVTCDHQQETVMRMRDAL